MFKSRLALCSFVPFQHFKDNISGCHFNKSSTHLHCCSLICKNTTTTKHLATLAAFKICFSHLTMICLGMGFFITCAAWGFFELLRSVG